jgi:hypothetical protein
VSPEPTGDPELEQRVAPEVADLHVFFEGWLSGVLAREREIFERLERALAPGFEIVTPGGAELGREVLLESLRGAHGSSPGLALWTEACRVLSADPGGELVLARYEELQRAEAADEPTRRVSTVVFERALGGPLRWLRVHETWASA